MKFVKVIWKGGPGSGIRGHTTPKEGTAQQNVSSEKVPGIYARGDKIQDKVGKVLADVDAGVRPRSALREILTTVEDTKKEMFTISQDASISKEEREAANSVVEQLRESAGELKRSLSR